MPASSWSTSTIRCSRAVTATVPLSDARATALQFRYLWVTDAEGAEAVRRHQPRRSRSRCPSATVPLADARRVYLARTYAYVAAGREGLVIVNVTRPETPASLLADAEPGLLAARRRTTQDVIVASTNASLFAYVADGRNGMKVLQLTQPGQPAQLLRLLAAAGARADRLGADPDAGAGAVARASTATARSTRPAARSRCSAASARGRSTAARWSACTSTARAGPIQVTDTGSMEDWVGPRGAIAAR